MHYFKTFIHSLLLMTTLSLPLSSGQVIPPPPQENISEEKVLQIFNLSSYDDLLALLDSLEEGELEKRCTPAQLEELNYFFASMAREGLLPDDDEFSLENDIGEMFHQGGDLFSSRWGGEIVLVPAVGGYTAEELILRTGFISKSWKATKKFVKKHKTAILIGVAVAVVGGVVIYAVVTSSSAAGAIVGGAAAAANSTQKPTPNPTAKGAEKPKAEAKSPLIEAPVIQKLVDDNVSSLKEHVAETLASQPHIESQKGSNDSIGDMIRGVGSLAAHDLLDAAAELIVPLSKLNDGLHEAGSKILPRLVDPLTPETSSQKRVENNFADIHKQIDQFFSTDHAPAYTPEAKAQIAAIHAEQGRQIAILPPPGSSALGGTALSAGRVTSVSREATLIAEEAGLAEVAGLKEIGSLEKAASVASKSLKTEEALASCQKTATLEESAAVAAKPFQLDAAGQASKALFDRAEDFLKQYKGSFFSESQARELIHETGIKTYSRPHGIPDNFRIKLSNTGAGMKYIDPVNENAYIRVMPGKPHSPNPCQQKPYVVQARDGMAIDKFGNRVPLAAPEAHIPVEEFLYRSR